MKWHPASMMLSVWAFTVGLFVLLPFHIVNRQITTYGYAMLFVSIMCFCLGAWVRSPALKQRHAPVIVRPDFSRVDPIVLAVAVVAMVVMIIEWRAGSGGDLDAAWQIRSDRTTALLNGTESGSSLTFQIGFLLSPIGYVIIARELIFQTRVRIARLAIFGFGPGIFSSLALGGRGPLLVGFIVAALSFIAKRLTFSDSPPRGTRRALDPRTVLFGILAIVAILIALNYFVEVFVVRAGGASELEGQFDQTADNWAVTFDGPTAQAMKNTIGGGNTYLVFLFSWYWVQGIVISNTLFSFYSGSAQLGAYGIEVVSALMRRVDGATVGSQNLSLFDLNVFGFVPSAFGTLYVDYWFFGLAVAFIWGYLAATVYAKTRVSVDGRWILIAPFVMQGVLLSNINTPFGATNGFVTHLWLLFVFLLTRPSTGVLRAARDVASDTLNRPSIA